MSNETQKEATVQQLPLPYDEISETAGRKIIRETAKGTGRVAYWIPIDKIYIREGAVPFNYREDYGDIPAFAAYILGFGVPDPLVVDMLRDGTCLIEQGYRRWAAITLIIHECGGDIISIDVPGFRKGCIECFVNDQDTTELERFQRQYSSNAGKNFTPKELGKLALGMRSHFLLDDTEIAKRLGISRQNVPLLIAQFTLPEPVQQAIIEKKISPTDAARLSLKLKDDEKLTEEIMNRVPAAKVQPGVAEKRIEGEDAHGNAKGERDDNGETFDETREEIRLCQRVIKNADKINTMVGKIANPGLVTDIDGLVNFIQKDMVVIRDFIKKRKNK